MKEKIIKFIEEQKHAINVRTQAEHDELMQYFEWLGFSWYGNEKPTEYNAFPEYKKDTCIKLLSGTEKICYNHFKIFSNINHNKISFNHFKEKFIFQNKQYQLHLAKLKVKEIEKEIEDNKRYRIQSKPKYVLTKKQLVELGIWGHSGLIFEEVE